MRIRSRTVDIVGNLVDELEYSFFITSVTTNANGTFTLTGCNTYHLQPKFKVTIDEIEYTITAVVRNTSITVSGSIAPTVGVTFSIYKPYYYHGTPTQIDNELTMINVDRNKTPLAFLNEELKEKYFGGDSIIDREVPIKIYFLTPHDPVKFISTDYHSQSIDPMRELALGFIERCERNKLIGKIIDWEINTLQRVGISTSGKDRKKFANTDLSGVELVLNLPIRIESCLQACHIIVTPSGFTWEDMTDTWETYTDTWETYQ